MKFQIAAYINESSWAACSTYTTVASKGQGTMTETTHVEKHPSYSETLLIPKQMQHLKHTSKETNTLQKTEQLHEQQTHKFWNSQNLKGE